MQSENLKRALAYTGNLILSTIVASAQNYANAAYCERVGYKRGGLMNILMNDRDRVNRLNNGFLF